MWRRMSAQNAGGPTNSTFSEWWQIPKQIYIRCSSELVPCPEAMGYTMGKTLGSGTYAKVKAAWSPFEGKMIAIKNLNKKQASADYLSKFLPREIAVLQRVTHDNVIKVLQIFETEVRCFFMLEIAENGDLLDYINTRRYLPEPEARFIFTQMCQAIAHCHNQDIVHRDLKCENIMLGSNMDVKIGDFGFALDVKTKPSSTPCGSYSYAAPELFTANGQPYNGKKADSWSMGVILYAMVCGRLPFGDDAQVKKMQAQHRQLTFSRNLTIECRGVIHAILNMDIESRPYVHKILSAEWTTAEPSTRPRQMTPALPNCRYKYTIENCLPSYLHNTKSRTSCNPKAPWSQNINAPYPTTQSYAEMIHQRFSKHMATRECSNSAQPQHNTSSSIEPDTSMLGEGTVPFQRHQSDSAETSSLATKEHRRPIVSKIGAAGRKIAGAMRSVTSQKKTGQSISTVQSEHAKQ